MKGFMEGYYNWAAHGEAQVIEYYDDPPAPVSVEIPVAPNVATHCGDVEQMNWDQRMVYDAAGPHFFSAHLNPEPVGACSSFPTDGTEAGPSSYSYDVSRLSNRFFYVVRAADQPLYNGCDESNCRRLPGWLTLRPRIICLRDAMIRYPSGLVTCYLDHTLPPDYYNTKKLIRDLGLPIEKIHACKNGCMLYWKDDIGLEYCKFCGDPRYKPTKDRNPQRKKSPYAVLRQRGFYVPSIDAEAWRHFDKSYPDFAVEPRNVRLALCTDGFAPHGQYGCTYSCWPVILTPYNFPPGMCMKPEYMFLTMVIPGPSNPKRCIDIYLEPLIKELLQLWHVGVLTHDHATNQAFMMRAALMWTINDLPAYGMASGWSTAGKTKDNLNARKDLKNICNRPELEVDERRPNAMPKAAYTLTKEQKKKICEWVRSLRFPDGYASNIARCVDIANLSFLRLDGAPHFHLPYEARVGGPVQYRWMYPFERPSRNDELTQNNDRVARDIFNHPGRTSGVLTKRYALVRNVMSFLNELYETYSPDDPIIDQIVATDFKAWFKRRVEPELQNIEDDLLKSLYWGPNQLVTTWSCYFVNGSSYTDTDIDFYGMLEEIIQLDYPVIDGLQVVLFKCKWVDPTRGMKLEEVEPPPKVNTDNQTYDLHDPNGLVLFVDISEAMQHGAGTSRPHDDDEEDEDEDEDEEDEDDLE
ncbi:UNVERIFIED_CONTAM: hypothetical protein Sradi_0675400 [Sesamum radiatum]|uniref:DUF4218 domain-containing protein n=1 Tax=Sesamum radiatum TaxID=300843 RepID=A0AAW2VL08_SESRA